jgi:CheY-like chemotaxis protein
MELNRVDFDLADLILQLKNLFESRCAVKELKWTVKELPGSVWVYGDENKLRQVLINLLGNAFKFTESGEVSLLVNSLDNKLYHFEVIDTGPGIASEQHEKIFEAFGQEKYGAFKGGTGLGLAISKRMVGLMGSDLKLESKLGEGSKFYFTLELSEGKNRKLISYPRVSKALSLAPGFDVTALIVDDIKENREVISLLLKDIGVKVCEAENGKEALEQARNFQPDIIFMDLRMPVMNGEEAIKALQSEFGQDRFKIIAISASVLDCKPEYYYNLGFHAYISKPFAEATIFNYLSELLNVEIVYEEETTRDVLDKNQIIDFSKFSLTESVYEKLKNAARIYNITNIERIMGDLIQTKAVSMEFIEALYVMIRNYDMKGMSQALERVNKIKELKK